MDTILNQSGNDLVTADQIISKKYYTELAEGDIEDLPEEIKSFDLSTDLRLFKANRFTYDNKELIYDKFTSVLNTVYSLNFSYVVLLNSDGKNTDLYFGVRRYDKKNEITSASMSFCNSLIGNFPGLVLENKEPLSNEDTEVLLNNIIKEGEYKSVNKTITSVSSLHSLKKDEKDGFVQGLEKLIEGNKDKKYTAIFIADPVFDAELQGIKRSMEMLYSSLSPMAQVSINYGITESSSLSNGLSNTLSHSVSASISHSTSHSESRFISNSKGSGFNLGVGGGVVGTGIGFLLGGPIGAVIGGAIGGSINVGRSTFKSKTEGNASTDTNSDSNTIGNTDSISKAVSESISNMTGKNENYELKMENKTAQNLLARIEENLKRITESENFGFWNFASYILSDDFDTSISVANNYKSLMRGETSHVESSAINTWTVVNNNDKDKNQEKINKISEYLIKLNHPRISTYINNNKVILNPGTLINTKELAVASGLPRKSVPGLPVINMAEFGRNINYSHSAKDNEVINIGHIYHLKKQEDNNVFLNIKNLTSHTFITGCTGSGKTNTILKILKEIEKKGIKYLLIEPAKGEYKYVLGNNKNVNVFGTNPKFTPLLKINPFSFPKDIHVLEHMDRLIEIINACWPMYAAMPAILKESIEKAYIQAGWDLENSINHKDLIFPVFKDLLNIIPETINNSLYSDTLKSDYAGALVTRVKSLTNGLYKRIFTDNEINSNILFDENCIIDISRIGSMETKALIMGIIFLKLKEYRESGATEFNAKLKHLTVLEEAHNLIKRTSTGAMDESGNLQGKAVEMISNSISEMRTYGEGFIIADQSPSLLDQAVIRNTNTKIIMKLPEESDRNIAGKSAALEQSQIDEIAKLETGVSVVYQNNWIEPVLCKVDLIETKNNYTNKCKEDLIDRGKLKLNLLEILLNHRLKPSERIEITIDRVDYLLKEIDKLELDINIKPQIQNYLNCIKNNEVSDLQIQNKFHDISNICCSLVDYEWIVEASISAKSVDEYDKKFRELLHYKVEPNIRKSLESAIIQCIFSVLAERNKTFLSVYADWIKEIRNGGIII